MTGKVFPRGSKERYEIYKVMKEPLLFELRELLPASYPELTTQGHLLHAMSLGSPRSEGGESNSDSFLPTNLTIRLIHLEIPGYNIYLKYFAFFV